jgi:hypothetical protein
MQAMWSERGSIFNANVSQAFWCREYLPTTSMPFSLSCHVIGHFEHQDDFGHTQ